ncbi:MAG: inorganic diphosphatase, partial [Clostridia bacterium]|nr:inorganic diphosphatase [Clostridia bacterium]
DDGHNDEKIIAVPFSDPNYNQYKSIDELPKHTFEEMQHFFTVYKALENKETAAGEVKGREDAIRIISDSISHYINEFCK